MAQLHTRYRNKEARRAGHVSGYAGVFYDPERDPRQKYVTLRTRDQKVARRRLRDLEKDESLGLFDPWRDKAPEYSVTLNEAVGRYVTARTHRRPRTVEEDGKTLERFQRALHPAIRLDNVEQRHVERFLDAPNMKTGEPNKGTTRRRYYNVVKVFFDWCVSEGLVRHNPSEHVDRPKVYRREARFLTRAELAALVAEIERTAAGLAKPEAGGRHRDVVWLVDAVRILAGTGLRIGELASLRWSAVQLDQNRIIVGRNGLTKSGHERVVPVAGDALETLRQLDEARGSRDGSAFVVPGARGGRLNEGFVTKRIRHFAGRAGLPGTVTSHTLRHTYGATLASAGVSIFKIQKLMGHDSVETTSRFYGHLNPEALHDAVESVFGR